MGQCGCVDINPIGFFQLHQNKFLIVDLYPGCDYCQQTIGVTLHFVDHEFMCKYYIDDLKKIIEQEIDFTESESHNFRIFDVIEDMLPAAKELEKNYPIEDYEFPDWIEENGLRLIQASIRSNSH